MSVLARLWAEGREHLRLGELQRGLLTLTRAVAIAPEAAPLERALEGLPRSGEAWRLAAVGLGARFPSPAATERLRPLRSVGERDPKPPVVVLAGDTDCAAQARMPYRDLLLAALSSFSGTLVSGGTRHGVAALAGDCRVRRGPAVLSLGYLPVRVPPGTALETDPLRCDELRRSGGEDFGVAEPLQYWVDLLAAGVPPVEVAVVGIGGGEISAFEYRLGLALGARVGVIGGSGRAADALLVDPDWSGCRGLRRLAPEPAALARFLAGHLPGR
jgi:hypothetical protein